jgi:hypothetical protein
LENVIHESAKYVRWIIKPTYIFSFHFGPSSLNLYWQDPWVYQHCETWYYDKRLRKELVTED